MRLGLIARTDNTGLGNQSWELYRHLAPAVTVAVSFDRLARKRGREHPERFPDAKVVQFDRRRLRPYPLEQLATCDVVLTVETPYDYRLLDDLRNRGVKTVVVGNREFLKWLTQDLPKPDLFIAPSGWRLEEWPSPTVLLPHPVDRERLPFRERTQAKTFLHIAASAMRDRSGTALVLEASKYTDADIVVKSSRPLRVHVPGHRARIEVKRVDDYWNLYDGDVLLAPRRFGGQSLPVVEAMSAGLPVIALNREPERGLLPPESLVPATRIDEFPTSGGTIGLWDADPKDLARTIDEFADDALVSRLSRDADRRAEALSWDVLGPRWREVLEDVRRADVASVA